MQGMQCLSFHYDDEDEDDYKWFRARTRASRMLIMIYSTHAACNTHSKEVMGGEDPKKQTPVPVMD
jgi:hypothetical protein